MKKIIPALCLMLIALSANAAENVINVYTWSGVIPDFAIRQFEKETGIKVNFSTYDSNEVMYAKLKADKNTQYDVIEPSSYYIDRMRRQGMLEKFDKTKLSNFKNLNPKFIKQAYDPETNYSLPFIWGITGIFLNKDYYKPHSITRWTDLWDKKYADQLLILDDSREVFSMALLVLGYSANDTNPEHIKQAYLKLKEIYPNVKLFNSAVISILIDEDATVGMVWNGDLFKAKKENSQLEFIYPTDKFVIWVDNFAIPKGAPHLENAYKFLNFMLRADVDKAVALDNNFPTANLAAQKLLPGNVKNNPTIYPSPEILRNGEFQTDIGDDALNLYEKYWEQLKMGG
ncbi:MAG: spermidine/putrescine ABC transporter substrate-binding protein [Gammaproteobacteria bacterium]|nr:spermidine/putrescine ABC transporter substrate-binding protein [Gammaproteobacteria bacterium]